MYFTGNNFVYLPQVKSFDFLITGLTVTDNSYVNFQFLDVSGNNFNFLFQNNLIYFNNNIISTYNSIDQNVIEGYISNNILNYEVNGINNQQNFNFFNLSGVGVNVNSGSVSGVILCDIIVDAPPLNLTVSFMPSYNVSGTLTGTIISDTYLNVFLPHMLFYGSNKQLLNNPYLYMTVNSGTNYYQFNDIDTDIFEYNNRFFISLPVTFGDIGGIFSSLRTGINNQVVMSLADYDSNVYYETNPFNTVQVGNTIEYSDTILQYNLGYQYSSMDSLGDLLNCNLSMNFYPLQPQNNSGYIADYITGYNIISSGLYNSQPNVSFAQYYYVTGIQNNLGSFLFSTGCNAPILITFSGGNPISGASGELILKPVRLSGIYNTGIASYNIVSGYSGLNNGFGYQNTPVFILHTGGNCYSLPDASGFQTAQFRYASGYGSIYGQAFGLTGIPLYTPPSYVFTGFDITNVGVGYNSGLPPIVTFTRQFGDYTIEFLLDSSGNPIYDSQGGPITISGIGSPLNASAQFNYKTSGLYEFNNNWNISYNIGNGYVSLSGYSGGYTGNVGLFGNGNINFLISLSGLDNTSPISGLLLLTLTTNGFSTTISNVISQSRVFNLSTGAMATNIFPTISFYPLSDLFLNLGEDQSYETYLESIGGGQNNIINF